MKHMQLGIRLGDDAVASHHWHFQGHADNCSYPYRYTFLFLKSQLLPIRQQIGEFWVFISKIDISLAYSGLICQLQLVLYVQIVFAELPSDLSKRNRH